MDQLTEEELRAEYRRAQLLNTMAESAGEADAEALWSSVIRSIANEAVTRRITL